MKFDSKFKIEYKTKFDKNFGKGSFDRLVNAKKLYSKNKYIRINSSKIKKSEIENFLKKNRVKFSSSFFIDAIKIDKSFFNISSSLPSLFGDIYIQDLASQIPVNLIDFSTFIGKEIRILDMAASPGSKTSQIAEKCKFLKINAKIIALEPNKARLQRLINNIQKQMLKNIEIINIEAENYNTQEKFDIILLDAPCSGNLIDDDKWLSKRNFSGIEKKSNLQKKLIKNAEKLLKKNGILVYSTCSLELEENEENILWAEKNTDLKSMKVNFKFPFEINPSKIFYDEKLKNKFEKLNCIRFQPYFSKTQGFFVGIFKK